MQYRRKSRLDVDDFAVSRRSVREVPLLMLTHRAVPQRPKLVGG